MRMIFVNLPVKDIGRFQVQLIAKLKTSYPQFMEGIRTGKALTPELEATLKEALEGLLTTFA